jgi:PAS domain S-box-containing protein
MSTRPTTSTAEQFLAGGGEMGERIRNYNWEDTSLGHPSYWPQNLKTCIRIILTSSQPMFVWWGKDLINIYNDAYKSIVKGKHPEALGQPASVVWKEIWDEVGTRVETVTKNNIGTYDEALLLIMERNGYPEETYYTFSYSPIAGEQGGVDGIICANTDTTERILSERQLRTLRDLGKNILNSTNRDEVCNKTIEVIKQNPEDFPFALIYQLENDGNSAFLCNKTENIESEKIAPPRFEINRNSPWWIEHVIGTGKITIAEDIHKYGPLPSGPWQQSPHKALVIPISQPGQKIPFAVLVVGMNPYRLPDEKYMSFFQLVADQIASGITTIQALEEERKRAEALAEIDKAKTIFFSNISHEFRTPLTLMLGPLEDLMQHHSNEFSSQTRKIVQTTHRNALRLLRLVNTLLDFSRIESGRIHARYQLTDIAAFTNDLASNFRSVFEKAGLSFNVVCEKINSSVYVDKEMWEKIVLNLLSNAFKYTLSGNINVHLAQNKDQVELKVEDTGVGIPEKELPRLFERFYRVENSGGRSHEGTGIGLALVNELVKFHQGTINVSSKEGMGTVFKVTIPAGKEHLPPAQVSEKETIFTDNFAHSYVQETTSLSEEIESGNEHGASDAPDNTETNKATVLIVDDNADMRSYLTSLLNKHYTTETAANGQEALDKIRANAPDIVLSDIMMPVMDGIQLLKNIKEEASLHIPVILLSARAGEEARIQGYTIGADDYLVKPFSAKELLARVQAQIKMNNIRKNIEDAEFRHRLALDSAQMGAWDLDLKTGNVLRNLRHAQIFGYKDATDQWPLEKLLEHVIPEDRDIFQQRFESARKFGSFELEWRIRRADKNIRWLKGNAQVLYDKKKVPVRIIGTVLDITDQKLQSEALKFSESRLRDMIMQAPVAIAILRGPDFVFEIANEDYFKIAGKPSNQIMGKSLLEALPEVKDQGIHEIMTNIVNTGIPFFGNEFPAYLIRNGKKELAYFNFVYRPVREANNSISGIMLVASEVTQQVIAKQKIQEAEERSRLAMEAADLGSYSIDLQTGQVSHTDRFVELFGFKKTDKIKHQDLIDTIHPEYAALRQKAHEEAAKTGVLNYEAKFIGPDNKKRWLKLSGKMFYNENQSPGRLLGAVMDITEQRELQQRKDDFIRMASHELKTPVTSIKGYVQLLLSMLDTTAKENLTISPVFKSSLATIDRQVVKLNRLMSELLDVSKIETGKLEFNYEFFNINEMVADVVQDILYTNTGHHISVRHDYVCNVFGDKDRLGQVFINIINNAIKYSPRVTEIGVRIYKEKSNTVAIAIKDYGIGIDPVNQERIFERFFRVEGRNEQTYPGFGIGLFIAKEIIERHQGTISVKSEKGKGSEFTILLPCPGKE